jgi:hypothetical protein
LGVVIADAPIVALFVAGGVIAVEAGVLIAAVSVGAVLLTGGLVARWLRRRRQAVEIDEETLLTAIELALLDSRDDATTSR